MGEPQRSLCGPREEGMSLERPGGMLRQGCMEGAAESPSHACAQERGRGHRVCDSGNRSEVSAHTIGMPLARQVGEHLMEPARPQRTGQGPLLSVTMRTVPLPPEAIEETFEDQRSTTVVFDL